MDKWTVKSVIGRKAKTGPTLIVYKNLYIKNEMSSMYKEEDLDVIPSNRFRYWIKTPIKPLTMMAYSLASQGWRRHDIANIVMLFDKHPYYEDSIKQVYGRCSSATLTLLQMYIGK